MVTLNKIIHSQPKTNKIQMAFRLLLGVFLLFAGFTHFTIAREEFLAQVPHWIPLDGDLVVILSGIVEVILGVSLLILGKYRAIVGWTVAIFFVAIFPGNITQYINRADAFGLDTDTARLIRLFFQPPLVLWALWSTGAWDAWRNRHTDKIQR